MDIKLFVDTDSDLRIIRRIKRDIKERGRTVDSVIEQYIKVVRPMQINLSNQQSDMQILLSLKVEKISCN